MKEANLHLRDFVKTGARATVGGLDIVREVRKRYDGRIRNPFNEYEWGHWYKRAMLSYGLIEGLTGVRYDAVDQVPTIDSRFGDSFQVFLSTENGFGTVGLKRGKPILRVAEGTIPLKRCFVSGQETGDLSLLQV